MREKNIFPLIDQSQILSTSSTDYKGASPTISLPIEKRGDGVPRSEIVEGSIGTLLQEISSPEIFVNENVGKDKTELTNTQIGSRIFSTSNDFKVQASPETSLPIKPDQGLSHSEQKITDSSLSEIVVHDKASRDSLNQDISMELLNVTPGNSSPTQPNEFETLIYPPQNDYESNDYRDDNKSKDVEIIVTSHKEEAGNIHGNIVQNFNTDDDQSKNTKKPKSLGDTTSSRSVPVLNEDRLETETLTEKKKINKGISYSSQDISKGNHFITNTVAKNVSKENCSSNNKKTSLKIKRKIGRARVLSAGSKFGGSLDTGLDADESCNAKTRHSFYETSDSKQNLGLTKSNPVTLSCSSLPSSPATSPTTSRKSPRLQRIRQTLRRKSDSRNNDSNSYDADNLDTYRSFADMDSPFDTDRSKRTSFFQTMKSRVLPKTETDVANIDGIFNKANSTSLYQDCAFKSDDIFKSNTRHNSVHSFLTNNHDSDMSLSLESPKKYCCSMADCSFQASRYNQLMKHLQEHLHEIGSLSNNTKSEVANLCEFTYH
eukprot:Awhi_evm1s15473